MHGKEFLKDSAMCFFIIVTCVNVVTYILGSRLDSDAQLTYEAFLSPIFFGACGSIPNIVMYSKHELSIKEIIIRKILQLILLELLLFLVTFGRNPIVQSDHTAVASFLMGVFAVFVAVHFITFLVDLGSAKAMTMDLAEFQKRNA